ncbi:hypothetical protein [Streptomyces sp. NPDC058653]|uniref:hypothetical protein n=1 Tax=Streptomyces sp. NPDC058653 TaxID=3346576 RepID=UPI003656CE96
MVGVSAVVMADDNARCTGTATTGTATAAGTAAGAATRGPAVPASVPFRPGVPRDGMSTDR